MAGETFDRTTFNANVTMQDLVDSYLLPFQVHTPHRAATPHVRHTLAPEGTLGKPSTRARLPLQACVEKGKVSGLMCSYNEVNGIPSCANSWLLTTVAREAWGFDGSAPHPTHTLHPCPTPHTPLPTPLAHTPCPLAYLPCPLAQPQVHHF